MNRAHRGHTLRLHYDEQDSAVFDHRLPLGRRLQLNPNSRRADQRKGRGTLRLNPSGRLQGDIETILQHHAAGTDIDLRNQWNATPLHYSARSGKLIGAQALVGVGADVNAKNDDGDTPLHFAASKGSAEIVTLLLTNKAKVDEPDAEG